MIFKFVSCKFKKKFNLFFNPQVLMNLFYFIHISSMMLNYIFIVYFLKLTVDRRDTLIYIISYLI